VRDFRDVIRKSEYFSNILVERVWFLGQEKGNFWLLWIAMAQ
jgi:hypothetical protein